MYSGSVLLRYLTSLPHDTETAARDPRSELDSFRDGFWSRVNYVLSHDYSSCCDTLQTFQKNRSIVTVYRINVWRTRVDV